MSIGKLVLGRIFAAWAAFLFVGSLLIIFIPVWAVGLLDEPRRSHRVFKIFRAWMKFFFIFSGVRRKITGKNNYIKGENYIVICNHNSFMDVPLSSVDVPGTNKTIAKSELAKIPLFGIIYKRGSVLVDRKSEESRRKSYQKMKQVLELGMHMVIYPEGTRNKTSKLLQPFHDGAFRLSVETGKQIMPAVILHTKEVLPRIPFFFWPRPVEMHFLTPIDPSGKTVQELKEDSFQQMLDFLKSKASRNS